jgi:hypothetical protein
MLFHSQSAARPFEVQPACNPGKTSRAGIPLDAQFRKATA